MTGGGQTPQRPLGLALGAGDELEEVAELVVGGVEDELLDVRNLEEIVVLPIGSQLQEDVVLVLALGVEVLVDRPEHAEPRC
ncbi:hypothetical protein [Streptomyces coeruleorubidus]|uniref:hypothetical protein n=1 Tax=Streptomyces coeruleorubidus TaxID=116188 RepID=UPI00379C4649